MPPARPLYRISANSTSVITRARRHSRAKKNTVSIPLITMFHQSQLPATPFAATSPVTTSGVSAANVVATIAAPASHQGTWRPERKYSLEALAASLREDEADHRRQREIGERRWPSRPR